MVFRTNDALSSRGFSLKFQQLSCRKNEDHLMLPHPQTGLQQSDQPHDQVSMSPAGNMYLDPHRDPVKQNEDQMQRPSPANRTPHQTPLQTLQSQVPSSKPACDYIYTDKQFWLQSENYSTSGSGGYPDNSDCSYFVKRNSSRVCYLEL